MNYSTIQEFLDAAIADRAQIFCEDLETQKEVVAALADCGVYPSNGGTAQWIREHPNSFDYPTIGIQPRGIVLYRMQQKHDRDITGAEFLGLADEQSEQPEEVEADFSSLFDFMSPTG